uniref:Uncharacterized protein n=1 Tax=Spongospora subterranea TaxID=70186 RepID=A0A0H5RLV7_9EUKA|eukprot:CRZ09714.1 hypothetical protein [Spongospora subterranea]
MARPRRVKAPPLFRVRSAAVARRHPVNLARSGGLTAPEFIGGYHRRDFPENYKKKRSVVSSLIRATISKVKGLFSIGPNPLLARVRELEDDLLLLRQKNSILEGHSSAHFERRSTDVPFVEAVELVPYGGDKKPPSEIDVCQGSSSLNLSRDRSSSTSGISRNQPVSSNLMADDTSIASQKIADRQYIDSNTSSPRDSQPLSVPPPPPAPPLRPTDKAHHPTAAQSVSDSVRRPLTAIDSSALRSVKLKPVKKLQEPISSTITRNDILSVQLRPTSKISSNVPSNPAKDDEFSLIRAEMSRRCQSMYSPACISPRFRPSETDADWSVSPKHRLTKAAI